MIGGSDTATGDVKITGTPDALQIGEVAERVGLSLRTIRYYEEAALVAPSMRTQGGFRLYGEADIQRLELVKRMKPLGFTLDEMREFLQALDALSDPAEGAEREALDRLQRFAGTAQERCVQLRERYESAVQFATMLRDRLASLSADAGGE